MIKNLERIAADYSRMWAESKDQLRRGDIEPDPVPDNSSKRWGVSVVIRPTEPVVTQLLVAANTVRTFAGENQVIYGKENLHTTLCSLEFQRLEVTANDPKVRAYEAVLKSVAARFKAISIQYKGITANRSGVMAQGWPLEDKLQEIREAFHTELEKRGLLGGPEESSIRQTAHASLAVFTKPLENPHGLVDFIAQNRETDFGTCTLDTIELVRYRRTESAVGLEVFAKSRLINI